MNTFRDRDAEKVFSVDEFWQFVIGNYGAIDETASYTVQGIYQPNIAGRNDEGWCYEKLASENGNSSLTILTSLKHREYAGSAGSIIRVSGNLKSGKSVESAIKYSLKANYITKVSGEPKFTEKDRDKAFAILEYGRQSADASLSIFSIFAKHRHPYIGLICCKYSKAWKDFEVGLAEAKDKYNIDEIKTDSSSAEVYNSALAQAILKGYDAICIMRGGGWY